MTQAARNKSTLSGSGAKRLRQAGKPIGNNQPVQVEDIPSDISEDEWGEIQRFGQKLHEEQIKKVKKDHKNRIDQVRQVLDQQVKLRE